MSNLMQKVLSALGGGPWRLVLEKRDHTFVLTAHRGKKSVPFRALLDRHPPVRQICASLPIHENPAIVPLHSLIPIRQALPGLASEALQVDLAPDVAAFRVLQVPPEFAVSYAWSPAAGCLERQVGMGAAYCGGGWFLLDNSAWCIDGVSEADDAWLHKPTITGPNLTRFLAEVIPLWQKRHLPVSCALQYTSEPAMALNIRYAGSEYLDCAVVWNAPAASMTPVPSLPGYVLTNMTVRPGPLPEALGEHVPLESAVFRIAGQQVPLFVRDVWPHVQSLTAGAVAALQEQHRILTGDGTLRLTVRPADEPEMRAVLASPVFACEDVSCPAELLSQQLDLEAQFLRLPSVWVPAQVVRQTGIGPLGRLTGGAPLGPIALTAAEVLRRGARRLEGPWSRIDFPELVFPTGGSLLETAQAHLELIYRWRIPGGLIGDVDTYQGAVLTWLQSVIRRHSDRRILVVASKKDLNRLDAAWSQLAAARFDGNRRDPQPDPMPTKLVLVAPEAVTTIRQLEGTQWDLLCLLGADMLIKTPVLDLCQHLNQCKYVLALGLFSNRNFIKRTRAREALSQVFRIPPGEDGDLIWKYGLRNPREAAPALPPPYPFQGKSQPRPNAVRPAELIIGAPAKTGGAVPIPPRPPAASSVSVSGQQSIPSDSPGIHIEVRYSTGDESFLAAARSVVDRSEARARFVPFQCYWPTYSSMTREQQRWYFYWRSQVRAGRYPDTDLSYIFVYVYELINLVGVRNADEGYERLRQIWRNYRSRFPKLDRYLIDWLADYAAVYRPGVTPFAIYAEALAVNAAVDTVDLILPSYLGQPLSQLPLPVIEALNKYRARRSRFYSGHQELVDKSIPAAVHAVDLYMRQRFGQGIFDLFHPGTAMPIQRQTFQSARYAGNVRRLTLGSVVPFSDHPPLLDFMTGVVKHTENTLRKQTGYKGKLSGYTLEPEIRAVIEECLGIPQAPEREAPASRQVEIDLAQVQRLQSESDQVRDMLLKGNEGGAAETAATPLAKAPEVDTRSYPVDEPANLQPVHDLLSGLGASEKSILLAIVRAGGQIDTADLGQALPGVLVEAGIDTINDRALSSLGDVLIAEEMGHKVLADDYRDDLEDLLSQGDQAGTDSDLLTAASQLPAEWDAFSRQLTDPQLAVLEVVIAQQDVSDTIRLIAEANASMPGALLDSINQLAMNTIGDIILDIIGDPPTVEDEDIDMVRQLLVETSIRT